jgi:hypothetical protein
MPQPKKAPIKENAGEGKTLTFVAPTVTEANIEEQIRRRAYELYEQRGRHEGFAEQDWLRAETEVRARQRARRSA